MRIGLYPGTFDPVTNGHLDIIGRAVKLVDKLVIGVAVNIGKGPLFTLEERVATLERETAHLTKIAEIEVRPFDTLLMYFAREVGARTYFFSLASSCSATPGGTNLWTSPPRAAISLTRREAMAW